LLNGTKRFITGAASHAYVVFATKDPRWSKGVSAFLVMKDDPGVEFGRKEDKMGIRGSPTREVIVTDTRIPADRLIGEEERVRVRDANGILRPAIAAASAWRARAGRSRHTPNAAVRQATRSSSSCGETRRMATS
jgi:alkylation response protein AidB-like acyl-CoA dehydrogenase